ncbi:glycerophosphodiester phosphodiesterase [Cellulophaga lytica]|uniref:Glycerophosphoryl diester phosphodiesterase n=1 Tax=Cellulophaga lytica (strain ATCC 23178 / DSM 7489 / JCM 8516 / NBRC 14961 / NCIMB 1423 / VKM B-1433 / Cy l20) TaxID=867900 RepID=F0RCY7_CELLC|nr:glycerophosphodiester phosphodiesterase family protein [Cellulophaga lytica]ADY28674.1 glycerophosphoryl diester phosphodiesterase [Cellulophaga lytica DSM 7489]APU09581.1 glycerophosphodiester phosphodiesterase [Cellulophaga lytica]WQG77147.1 glycerophosphodiester phosphodiesterase family protein [Cellulophaga lytica]
MIKKLLVIGHRGAMGHKTENTLASVKKALELKVDMIEIDVFKIKSGEIIVFHDDEVNRLTNGTGKVEDYTWQQLQELTLVGNHKIPLLTTVLDTINAKVAVNVELKGAGTANDVNAILEEYINTKNWKLDQFFISSFNWDELIAMRTINSKIAIGVLTEEDPLQALPMAKQLKAVSINADEKDVTKNVVEAIQLQGFKLYTYTVNAPENIVRLKNLFVDGIFTNYPERVY